MANGVSDGPSITRLGVEALQRGDARAAARLFEQAAAVDPSNPGPRLLAAHAYQSLGEMAAHEAAVDQTLTLEPRNLRALILKGDCLARAGNARGADAFYRAALAAAAGAANLPPALAADLRRVETLTREAEAEYQRHLEEALGAAGLEEEALGDRFREGLDILFGRRQVFFQQPTAFYFPRLPQIQFYDRNEFAFLAEVEAATEDIRSELLAVLEEEGAFRPYVEEALDRPIKDHRGMLGNPSWSAFYLWNNGVPVPENAARFPKTMAALRNVPLTRINTRAPSILFSLLRPGAHIPPHHGMMNSRLICHLPLIVPPGCRFRVGNETREWEEGKVLVFDDSIEHEAWNDSDRNRVILLFEIWRPELSEQERHAVATLFEAIDSFGGSQAGESL